MKRHGYNRANKPILGPILLFLALALRWNRPKLYNPEQTLARRILQAEHILLRDALHIQGKCVLIWKE